MVQASDSDTTATDNVRPICPFDEEAAIAWLRAQPGGRTKLSDAELARRWGWNRKRAGRRIKAWAKSGRITRRGDVTAVTAAGTGGKNVPPRQAKAGTGTRVDPVPPPDPQFVPPPVPLPVPPVVPPRPVEDVRLPPADAPPIAPTEVDTPPAERVTIIRVVAGIASYVAAIAIDVVAYATAIGLASVAALFSIKGMVQLFPGAPLLIIAMASMMEASKLVTAGWLARRWRATIWLWRLVLVVLVAGLALINAAGVYAQLVAAHVGERGAATSDIEVKDAALAAKLESQIHIVADLDRRLAQIDAAVEKATERGRTTAAMKLADDQRKARAGLVDERKREAGTLAALKAERASLSAKGRQIETEAVPIRYVAEFIGVDTDSEKAIRWLIALMVLCCDPLAIALTAAASARRSTAV
jgi:hypothetical protein